MGTLSGMPTWDARIKQRGRRARRAMRARACRRRGAWRGERCCARAGEAEAEAEAWTQVPGRAGRGGVEDGGAGAAACKPSGCPPSWIPGGGRPGGHMGRVTLATHVGSSRSKLSAIPVRFGDADTTPNNNNFVHIFIIISCI